MSKANGTYLLVDPVKFKDAILDTVGENLADARIQNSKCEHDSLLIRVPIKALATKAEVKVVQAEISEFTVE